MFQSLCLVNATPFNGDNDKNGESPVLLNVLAGKAVNRTVISGTIAKRNGFEVGKMYVVQITEKEADAKYGRQFNINKIADVAVSEMFGAITSFGPASILDIDKVTSTKEVELKIGQLPS